MVDGLRPLSLLGTPTRSGSFVLSQPEGRSRSSSNAPIINNSIAHSPSPLASTSMSPSSSASTSASASASASVSAASTPTRPRTPDDTHTPTPSRLKRLSLVARRNSGVFLPLDSPTSAAASPSPSSLAFEHSTSHTSAHNHTPQLTSPSPLRTGPRPRPSSISYSSYSPRISGSFAAEPSASSSALGLGLVDARVAAETAPAERGHRRSGEMPSPSPLSKGPLTLADQHGDLLRAIAARERRVTELRQELAQQEQALAGLRARWTAIANNAPISTTTPPPQPRRTRSGSTAQRASLSVSSTASLPTVPDEDGPEARVASDTEDHENQPRSSQDEPTALGAIWNVIQQDADDTIAEGKRFWGQLMRTVGAAAGGTVPEPDQRQREAWDHRRGEDKARDESVRDKLESNLSGLRTMLPSVSLPFSLAAAAGSPPGNTPTTPPLGSSPPINSTSPPLRPGSIRLHRPTLSPSPSYNGRPLTRSISGASTASNASIGSVASQMSDGHGNGHLGSPVKPTPASLAERKRENRKTWAGSPSRAPALLVDTSLPELVEHREQRRPSPVNVVLDGVLW